MIAHEESKESRGSALARGVALRVDERCRELALTEYRELAVAAAGHVGDREEVIALGALDLDLPTARERLRLSMEWSRQHRVWRDAPDMWHAYLFGDEPGSRGTQGHPSPDMPEHTRAEMMGHADELYREEAAWQLNAVGATSVAASDDDAPPDAIEASTGVSRTEPPLSAPQGFSRRAFVSNMVVRRRRR